MKNYKKYKQIKEALKATDISSLVCHVSSFFHNARLNGKVREGYRRCKKHTRWVPFFHVDEYAMRPCCLRCAHPVKHGNPFAYT